MYERETVHPLYMFNLKVENNKRKHKIKERKKREHKAEQEIRLREKVR